MITAYSVIANDGVWIEPKLLHSTMRSGGRIVGSPFAARKRVLARRSARKMVRILSGVTTRGTGIEAQVPGYQIAGKTGTAQKPLPGGGYGNSYVASFAGFAPARNPAVIVMVVLDDPSPIWGGSSAAPTFRTITEFALRHLGVAPTTNAERAAQEIEADHADEPVAHD
jgi:cell division protein FtsI/penicillin-binding protein 2